MTVTRSPLSSPVKRPTSLLDLAAVEELIKKPVVEDVEAGPTEPVKTTGFRCIWRSFALIFAILLTSLILINGLVIVLGLIDLL